MAKSDTKMSNFDLNINKSFDKTMGETIYGNA